MNLEEKATSITVDRRQGKVTILWADGHSSVYPFSLIRAACPCASCRGGHENMNNEPDRDVFNMILADSPATRIESVRNVGSYAISFHWKDNHDFGIYTWHYLRLLCPCDECEIRYRS
ncbi:MAG: DUF971 domain-containing protein [Anaerolineaceae bacterium]|nr:DUF971 domain-containing protein [Anaerolineaceae bacterium]